MKRLKFHPAADKACMLLSCVCEPLGFQTRPRGSVAEMIGVYPLYSARFCGAVVSIRSRHGDATTNATPSELSAEASFCPISRVNIAASQLESYTVDGVPFP